jgi:uridine kinase
MRRPFVVSVSGTSGGGKTTLLHRTGDLLRATARLFFDDYISVSNQPEDVQGWLDAGADPNAFRTPGLAAELRRLLEEESGAPFILIEDPFGKARAEIAGLIDFSVFLRLPPEVALARRILRTIVERQREPDAQLEHLAGDLITFLSGGREAYEAANRAAAQTADLSLDGMRDADELARELAAEILKRRGRGDENAHEELPERATEQITDGTSQRK